MHAVTYRKERKGKEEYLYSVILADTPLRKRSDMDHTVLPAKRSKTCENYRHRSSEPQLQCYLVYSDAGNGDDNLHRNLRLLRDIIIQYIP